MPKKSLYARAWAAFTTTASIVSVSTAAAAAPRHQQPTPCAECIVLTVTPEQSALVTHDLHGIEILVRSGEDEATTRTALERVRLHRGRAGLWIAAIAAKTVGPDTAALAERVIVDLSAETRTSGDLAFFLKTYFTDLRSVAPAAKLGFYARPDMLDALREQGLDAYIDFSARDSSTPPPYPVRGTDAAISILSSQTRFESGDKHRLDSSSSPAELDPERWVIHLPEDPEPSRRLLADIARAAPILRDGLIPGGMVQIRCGDRTIATYLNPESLDTIAVAADCRYSQLSVAPESPETNHLVTSSGDLVVRVPSPEGRFAQGIDVRGARTLSVREIIARHQAVAARHRRQVRHLISTGRLALTFEAPGFPAPMTISTSTVIYTERAATEIIDIEQRDVRVNGIAFTATKVPRLPLLEPERVASLPLAIGLTDVYRYSLEGRANVSGVDCYVVRFDPIDRRRNLFAGRVWISVDEFAMVKVSAVQTGLRGPIVSSEQTDEFRREMGSLWLLARSDVHQVYEGAGHRTPIHRRLTIDRHEINPRSFAARRQAAYTSPSIMLRDTADGFRYLHREPSSAADGAPVVATTTAAAERVRTIAVGVILDPNISRPLPFAGLSYVDFNLFGTGAQLNGFFGGTFGQLALAVPSLGGTKWRVAARAFGIASSYNDRAFNAGREDYASNISQRPAHASAWVLRPLTARVTARAGYEFDYTAYGRVDSTSLSFVVPAAQKAHAVRLGVDAQWGGWSAAMWWSGARRAGWRHWGQAAGEYERRHDDYQRFGFGLTRAFVTSPRFVGRVETGWMAGRDLDRFSRYSFGSFDNRLHGFPSALIRYDRGGVVRVAAAWAAGRRLRLDMFLDDAFVRDPNFGRRSKNYTGIGVAAEVPAPFGTLAAIEWGYGIQGIDSEGRQGTQVIRITGYKMF